MPFKGMTLEVDYSGPGRTILNDFVLPFLDVARRYDRITSFFTVGSLLAISEGLDSLRRNGGSMRLVLGLHDIPEQLAEAAIESDDAASAIIAGVRERVLSEVTTIKSEFQVQQLACIAWMLQDNLLQIRVAAPKSIRASDRGIFHSKAFIFSDECGDVVVGVGSANETVSGLGANFEHLMAFSSWDAPQYTSSQVRHFERLWANDIPELCVRELGADFARELLAALPLPSIPAAHTYRVSPEAVLRVAREMAPLSFVAGKFSALFPHQERAYLDALSRWPVRVLLADEVGLGKTFETSAVVKHLLSETKAARVLFLVPKAVLKQWQDELREHFDVDAWLFHSSTRTFVSSQGVSQQVKVGEPVLGPASPKIVLMSAQYARGSRRSGSIASDISVWPDVLVVDEAHAARTHVDEAGRVRPTLLWRLLEAMCPHVPHVIFATATPMQVHWREYFGLLLLLGLPTEWRSPEAYERSLRLIADSALPSLQDALAVGKLVVSVVTEMKPSYSRLTPEEVSLTKELVAISGDLLSLAMLVHGKWGIARSVLVKLHPAHLLTIRNTRSALTELGYKFPERRLHAPELAVTAELASFYQKIDEYLNSVYFDVERACFPDRKFNSGFVRSSYQQRLASSLHSCRQSMFRRQSRVREIAVASTDSGLADATLDELLDSETFEDGDMFESRTSSVDRPIAGSIARAARIEIQWLTDLLTMLDEILSREKDPKLAKIASLLTTHLPAGDRVLVFSRYTDTLDAVIQECISEEKLIGVQYGLYTGQDCLIGSKTDRRSCTRAELLHELDTGRLGVVFCSEAASEGLNLQTARVLVNVDVPWNPARLEQRIGRIARLGQKARSVDVYNLWYPDSVEAKMYRRLLQRRDLYELAVGEFPEVVGSAIRDAVASRYGGPSSFADPITELQRLRNNTQLKALRELWGQGSPGQPTTRLFREELAAVVLAEARRLAALVTETGGRTTIQDGRRRITFSLDSGEEDTMSLSHSSLAILQGAVVTGQDMLVSLWDGSRPFLFAVRSRGTVYPLHPREFPRLIRLLTTTGELVSMVDERTRRQVEFDDTDFSSWMPSAAQLTIPADLQCGIPPLPKRTLPTLQVRTAIDSMLVE